MKTVSSKLGRQKPHHAKTAQERYEGSEKAQEKKKRLEKIEELVLGGCPRDVAIKSTGIGRRTYYTHKKAFETRGIVGLEERSKRPHKTRNVWLNSQTYKDVLEFKKQYPTSGRNVIHLTLLHQGRMPFSVSTVGRILKYAKDKKDIA